jgi:hypothetical protein
MPNGKHRITNERADKLMAGMKALISNPDSPLNGFPEGFIFDVDAVRKLIDHPDAAHFIIRFGWKEEENAIAPVLCVADKNRKILDKGAKQPVSATTRSLLRDSSRVPEADEDAGGYLDEGNKYP